MMEMEGDQPLRWSIVDKCLGLFLSALGSEYYYHLHNTYEDAIKLILLTIIARMNHA